MKVVELGVRLQQVVEDIGWVREVRTRGVDEDGQLVERGAVEEIAGRMKVHGAPRRAIDLILQVTGDSSDRRVRREIQADLSWELCLVESGSGRYRIEGGRRPVEISGHAGTDQVVPGSRPHLAAHCAVRQPPPGPRLAG